MRWLGISILEISFLFSKKLETQLVSICFRTAANKLFALTAAESDMFAFNRINMRVKSNLWATDTQSSLKHLHCGRGAEPFEARRSTPSVFIFKPISMSTTDVHTARLSAQRHRRFLSHRLQSGSKMQCNVC